MEQFSLDKWLQDKSRKVVTRKGKSVRIICTDSPVSHHPIVGFVECDLFTWTNDGKVIIYGSGCDDENDLFFADEEEELTELQKTLEEDCDCYVNLYNDGKTRVELREWIKAWCPRIIDLARKELLKDLPKWKKVHSEVTRKELFNMMHKGIVTVFNGYKDYYYLDKTDLGKLPKEE